MIHYVTGLMFSKDMQKVLLIKKLKPDWQYGRFNGLGGKVEENESNAQAISREFCEECGIKTQIDDWQEIINITSPHEYQVSFLYTRSDNIFKAQTLEQEPVQIFDIQKLPEQIIDNLPWIISLCLSQKIIIEI